MLRDLMPQEDENQEKIFHHLQKNKGEQPPDQPPSFNLTEYIKTYRLEIGLICICIFSLLVIRYYTENKKVWDATRILMANVDSYMVNQFEEAYPDGYKVIAYAYKKIILTEYDTMPKEFHIDWKKLELLKLSRDSVTIRIPNTKYANRGAEVSEITQSFLRNIFSPTSLYNYSGISFEIQIINQEENKILFLFGIFDETKELEKKSDEESETIDQVHF